MSLFKSLQKRSLFQRALSLLWPRIGFKRSFRYLFLRLMRLSATPYAIAAGLATGVAVSFTPFLGGHILLSLAVSWILRANKIAALLGTLVGTPWTLPFMLLLSYKVGKEIINILLVIFPTWVLPFETYDAFDVKVFYNHPESLFFPTLIGSLPVGGLMWGCVFILARIGIKYYKTHRATS